MPLNGGSRLAHYDVSALIGEGGMGQVWQATDTQLNRQVALKILPDAFAADPDRLARFTREAQILASLNHPNIAAIYGIEESDGTRALVLELVEGPTLADRISKGPIPLDEALPIAKQIAEALEAAHEAGVIHRDLKPANIKVREDGTVKVLDFGLAKALDPNPDADPSQSPTLTAAATQMGVIMGTAAYMSPEQASGSTADKRADIWSFGVVLYEMLTGQRLFTGETVSHVLAGVLREEPAWGALPDATPSPITRLLSRCLKKDRKHRLRDIGDALVELNDDLGREPVEAIRQSRSWARPALAFTAVGLLAFLFGWQMTDPVSTNTAESFVHRVSLDVSDAAPLAFDARTSASGVDSILLDISPDGRTIVFVGETDGESRLYVRRLDSFLTRPLQGTEGAVHPFFSPDGESVGFLTEDKVQAIRLAGGAPRVLADAVTPAMGTWLADGTIYFGDRESTVLSRIPATGGEVEEVIPFKAFSRIYGEVLPDGRHVFASVITGSASGDHGEIQIVSLSDGASQTLISNGYDARYAPPG